MTDLTGTRRGYDLVADRYAAAEISDELDGKPLDRALLDTFTEITAGAPVLDVRYGPGHAAAYLGPSRATSWAWTCRQRCAPSRTTQRHYRSTAAGMTAPPVRSQAVAEILCLYTVIHLDPQRQAARTQSSPACSAPAVTR